MINSAKFEGHTPGPWHLGVKQAEAIVYDSRGWAIANAIVYHGEHDAEVGPNAHLIAAAPTLLAENAALRAQVSELSAVLDLNALDLERLWAWYTVDPCPAGTFDDHVRHVGESLTRARAALAKVTP